MSATGSMATGWYMLKQRESTGQEAGPYTWEQLYELAQTGALQPGDLVWNAQMPSWLPAAKIPGLVAGAAILGEPMAAAPPSQPTGPLAQPGPSPVSIHVTPPGAGQAPPSRPPKHKWLWPVLIPLIALIIVGGALGGFFALHGTGKSGSAASSGTEVTTTSSSTPASTVKSADIGTIQVTLPDSAKLVKTAEWGEVPANQLGVMLADGLKRADADTVAQALGGTVVGELGAINTYQIQTAGSTEADLEVALEKAKTLKGVELAFPDQQAYPDEEIWGVRQTPLDDPAYSGNYGKDYQLIGAQKAWSYMRGSGLSLSPVQVGVVDDGLYKGTNEFGGTVKTSFPDQNAGQLTSPEDYNFPGQAPITNPDGSHGTAVAAIIGADPDNGGVTGIASPALGKNLTISAINQYAPPYGGPKAPVPADPNDPTKITLPNGRTYVLGDLAAMLKQVNAGSRVINCSFGAEKPDPNEVLVADAFRKFFEKMAKDHPDVTFVCAAGNESGELSKTNYWPAGAGSGLANVITVGNVMNDGGQAESTNTAGADGEVTIAAPGDEAIRSVDASGKPVNDEYRFGKYGVAGGTSMATPQVSAAAALLISLNPKLTAEQIKKILVDTSRPGPEGLGGGILAVDEAVLKVINDQRAELKLPALSSDELENMGVIDAVATSTDQPNVYDLKGILKSVPDKGTEVTITTTGGVKVEGDTNQALAAAGEVDWPKVTISGDDATITVTRKDSGAASVIAFQNYDINGKWAGTLTFTDVTLDKEAAQSAQDQGCGLDILNALKGKALPMTMDVNVDESGKGDAVTLIDTSSLNTGASGGNASSEPQTWPLTYSGRDLVFAIPSSGGAATSMTGTVAREGNDYVITGALSGSGKGYSFKAAWTVSKAQ